MYLYKHINRRKEHKPTGLFASRVFQIGDTWRVDRYKKVNGQYEVDEQYTDGYFDSKESAETEARSIEWGIA
jgi:hypothetical protein